MNCVFVQSIYHNIGFSSYWSMHLFSRIWSVKKPSKLQYKIYLKFITLGGSEKTLQSLFYSINFSNLQQYVFMLYLKVNLPYPVIDNSVFYLILSWCCVKLFYAVSYIGPWFGLIEMNLAYFLKSKSYSRIIFEPLCLQIMNRSNIFGRVAKMILDSSLLTKNFSCNDFMHQISKYIVTILLGQ